MKTNQSWTLDLKEVENYLILSYPTIMKTRTQRNVNTPSTPKLKGKRSTQNEVTPEIATPQLDSPSAKCETKSSFCPINKTRKRLYFGHDTASAPSDSTVQKNTRQVYAVVNKMTGSIGGNGHGGAIYGELTVGSMQKMIDLMKVHTNFGPKSRFIDVGSGLGKPNLHVAQDPGVEFSYGIEMEKVRWMLGMSNLNMVLQRAEKKPSENILHRCMFEHGDITEAKYFDPFTHVYMFDIGFPPKLFKQLSEMFNKSNSPFLICYHGPKLMIDRYGFNVELIVQASTSMHGSSECHSGYIYRRVRRSNQCQEDDNGEEYKYEEEDKENQRRTSSRNQHKKNNKKTQDEKEKDEDCRILLEGGVLSDPLFVNAWKSTRRELVPLLNDVRTEVLKNLSSRRPTRKRKSRSLAL